MWGKAWFGEIGRGIDEIGSAEKSQLVYSSPRQAGGRFASPEIDRRFGPTTLPAWEGTQRRRIDERCGVLSMPPFQRYAQRYSWQD
jgi:hypothetical protein